jgi:hypothetical protein
VYVSVYVSVYGMVHVHTQGVSLPQLRDMILGTPGSYVNLSFLREKAGEGFRYDIDLIRGDPNKV